MEPLRIFLGPKAIKALGTELDRMYPGVHLYENVPVGARTKFIRVLGARSMAYEVFPSKHTGAFHFRVKGGNGEIVAQSESYTREHDAHRGYAGLLKVVRRDVLKELLEIMFRGWQLKEASWDSATERYTLAPEAAMLQATNGDTQLAALLNAFSYWTNDIESAAAHYGVGFEGEDGMDGIRSDIPPAPSPEHYWDKGHWNPPELEQDAVVGVSADDQLAAIHAAGVAHVTALSAASDTRRGRRYPRNPK